MNKRLRVVQFGCGPIGQKTAQFILERKNLELVGAVDIDPKKLKKDIGELIGKEKLNIPITDNPEELFSQTKADACVLTTSSSLEAVTPQIKQIISYGINVISTCEELTYPWITNSAIANEIDDLAKQKNVSVLSTGVNPGFMMDFLPLSLTAVCKDVRAIKVERIQNAVYRRLPFQIKIGAGLSLAEFNAKKKEKTLRHVGLTESIQMIASKFGWQLDRIDNTIEPVIAGEDTVAGQLNIQKGNALGVFQTGTGYVNGREVISLVFKAAMGEPEPCDKIFIEGEPNIDLIIKGGINGDIATCAITVNAIPAVVNAKAGLRTMSDIELVSFF